MTIAIIVAVGENLGIGKDNRMPWHLPDDLQNFKKITKGHPIVMGRKTFESLGRPLPKRTNIVITKNENFNIDGVVVANSIECAIEKAKASPGGGEIFIIGGQTIYEQSLELADRLYVTEVECLLESDTFFPKYSEIFSKVVESSNRPQDEKHKYARTFKILEK